MWFAQLKERLVLDGWAIGQDLANWQMRTGERRVGDPRGGAMNALLTTEGTLLFWTNFRIANQPFTPFTGSSVIPTSIVNLS